MQVLDEGLSRRVSEMLDLVATYSAATTPQQVMARFAVGWRRLVGPTGYVSLACEGLAPGEYRITRSLLEMSDDEIREDMPWPDVAALPVLRGGLLGRIVEDRRPTIILEPALTDDPVLGDAPAGFAALMAIPLYHGGDITHWGVFFSRNRDAFTADQLPEHVLRSNMIGNTVRHVRAMQQLREAQARLRREVERIAEIQRALLPRRLPTVEGLSLAARYETFDQAGGDMYHVRPLDDTRERWALLIADVSGHGPAAAVVMAMVSSILATFPGEPRGPGQVLAYLNDHLYRHQIEANFVTAALGFLDVPRRTFTYAAAGHPPPLWRRAPDDIATLDAVGGLPLGVLSDPAYEESTVTLAPGQTLALYTDGITETRNPQGRFFGVDGIRRAMSACSGEVDCLVQTLHDHVRAHEAGRRPEDDQTVLAVRVNP